MLVIDYTSRCKNWNSRGNYSIKYIVIHATAGKFKSAVDWLCDKKSQVSAHYLISLEGVVVQLVNDINNAWHSGNSKMNRESIGIELESYTGFTELTREQDCSLTRLIRTLMKRYNIPAENLKMHREIKPTVCPINFDNNEWSDYVSSHFGNV